MILSCTQLILNMLVSQLSVSGVVGPSELLGGGGGRPVKLVLDIAWSNCSVNWNKN